MSLTPQDNARSTFAQANAGRQHVFQVQQQQQQPNNLPSPQLHHQPQQQHAFARPIQGAGLRQQIQVPQQLQQTSTFVSPYASSNGNGGQRAAGVGIGMSVSAEQQIAQGVLSNASNNGGAPGTPQRRPPPLGTTIHMPPHGNHGVGAHGNGGPANQAMGINHPMAQSMNVNQAMSVNHAMNPSSAMQQVQRQSQNASPALQAPTVQRPSMTALPANALIARQDSSPEGSAQDLSMIDPQLAIGQQLPNQPSNDMIIGSPTSHASMTEGEMLSPPPTGSFPTFDSLFAYAQAYALAHGYAFVIGRSKRDNRGLKKVFLICDRGGSNKEKVVGKERQRKTKSRKCGCTFGVFGLETKAAWLLRGRMDGENLTHNHPPSDSPTEHPGARKLDANAVAAVKALEENGVSVKETLEILHKNNPSVRYLARDIYNARAAIKRDPSRVEASAMDGLPQFYKKPALSYEEKLRAELRTEITNAHAETASTKEQWQKEVEELKKQIRNKDKQLKRFEDFVDVLNNRAMEKREWLEVGNEEDGEAVEGT